MSVSRFTSAFVLTNSQKHSRNISSNPEYQLLFKRSDTYFLTCYLLYLCQEPPEGDDSETPAESLAGPSQEKEGMSTAYLCR